MALCLRHNAWVAVVAAVPVGMLLTLCSGSDKWSVKDGGFDFSQSAFFCLSIGSITVFLT